MSVAVRLGPGEVARVVARARDPRAGDQLVGAGEQAGGAYSDIDMLFTPDGDYVHRDGTPYAAQRLA